MKKICDMDNRQLKVFNAVYNGWYMSGKYLALLDDHAHVFYADSIPILYGEVEKWYARHERYHGNKQLLVKCIEVL